MQGDLNTGLVRYADPNCRFKGYQFVCVDRDLRSRSEEMGHKAVLTFAQHLLRTKQNIELSTRYTFGQIIINSPLFCFNFEKMKNNVEELKLQ